MPTNEQRRAAAKRKLERQLERRAQQQRRRRLLTIIGAAVGVLVVVGAAVFGFMFLKDDSNADTASASPSSSPTSTPPTDPALRDVPPLPPFAAPAGLGSNCQYPATTQPASKQVNPPRAGEVPTDPAEVSVSMSTNQGNLGLVLDNAKTPCTVNSFANLAQQGYFNDTVCHRLTASPGLKVLQCGDPSGNGSGGPGYSFANEYPTNQFQPDDPALQQPVLYPRGTLAMANAGPNTNGSQFFLVYGDSQLPPNYTAFGRIDDTGLATLDKIAAGGVAPGPRGPDDGAPTNEVKVTSVLLD